MSTRAAEVAVVLAAAALLTAIMGAGVLRAPSERVFGLDIVGRHHDPFTVMQQFEQPIAIGVYSQPVTDIAGALLARLSGGVAAYNWLVLLSFPLAAATAYVLARHLTLSPAAATVAALAFAFSPFHVAQAAYHPHIAQIQWIPLYLLALWRCLDAATPMAVALLGAATAGVTLSNFYGGLMAAVLTPVAVLSYWLVLRPVNRRPEHALRITALTLALLAACGLAYASYVAHGLAAYRAAFAAPRGDLLRFGAQWWSYFVPPVAHPLLGPTAQHIWDSGGVRDGLLEQQVTLGWGIVALGLIAIGRWLWLIHNRQSSGGVRVPILVAVALTSFVCSLPTLPSMLFYGIAPMFRAYARFGVVVQLMAVLLAGIGVDFLRRAGTPRAQMACIALVILAAAEYAVAPSALWRDVMPTTAHRWIAHQTGSVRALDCVALDRTSQSIQWLTGYRVLLAAESPSDCTEPNFSEKLAATGYTHLLVRRDTAVGRWFAQHPPAAGFRVAARFEDAQVLAVTAAPPPIYTKTMPGFFRREHNVRGTWRWMAHRAAWTITNATVHPVVASLSVEMWAFRHARTIDVLLDGAHVTTLVVARARRPYEVGPLIVPPGDHALMFHAADAPTMADAAIANGDRRSLSVAVGAWHWNARGARP